MEFWVQNYYRTSLTSIFSGDWPVGQPSTLEHLKTTHLTTWSLCRFPIAFLERKTATRSELKMFQLKATPVSQYIPLIHTYTTTCNKSIWSLPFIFRTKQLDSLNHSCCRIPTRTVDGASAVTNQYEFKNKTVQHSKQNKHKWKPPKADISPEICHPKLIPFQLPIFREIEMLGGNVEPIESLRD